MSVSTWLPSITLNINGLYIPTKRYRLAEWIKKKSLYICCLQETHFISNNTYRVTVRWWKKILHGNGNYRKAGVAILRSDKTDFKIKKVTRDKEGHYIMTKGSIQEEEIAILNIYAPNIGAQQYIRQLLTAIKGEIDNNNSGGL